MRKEIIISIILILIACQLSAITWNEPWRKEIIQKSEHFVLGKVISTMDSIIRIEVLRDFSNSLQGEINIDGFFLLDICSSSGSHGPELNFELNEESYFFLKKGEKGNYKLPTPTSGADRIVEGKVFSTFRHSYHQAALDPEVYEIAYNAIWKYYNNISFENKEINDFINESLKLTPANFNEDEIDLFFIQHAALETAYLLEIDLDIEIVTKFIESGNFHLQISGLRAMGIISTDKSYEYLIEYVKNEEVNNFNKVIAIWSIWEFGSSKEKRNLWKLKNMMSDDEIGFESNLMDSRICTYFPSPKGAIIDLRKKRINLKTLWNRRRP